MRIKTNRFLLIPLGLLTILILAACAPAETAAPTTAPNQSNATLPTQEVQAMEETSMMEDNVETQTTMMDSEEFQTLANHMNATLAPMQTLATMMSDTEQATALMAYLDEMQQEMQTMLTEPDPERLGAIMQETSGLMDSFATMMASEPWDNHTEEALAQMEQLMLHMGLMAQSMETISGDTRFREQMTGYQQQFQEMMNGSAPSAQEIDAMMDNFGDMMDEMGVMFTSSNGTSGNQTMSGETSENTMMDNSDQVGDSMGAREDNEDMMGGESMEGDMMDESPSTNNQDNRSASPSQDPDNEMPGNNGDMGGGMDGG